MRGDLSFFFNDTATTEIYTLSLHDALPIFTRYVLHVILPYYPSDDAGGRPMADVRDLEQDEQEEPVTIDLRSEEHTSELQSRQYLVCRLLLEKKQTNPSSGCQVLLCDCAPA